jgi:leucyl-tRNA synthetase
MEYLFREIEEKWQKAWADNKTYKVGIDSSRPKYYVLDMFPYPSGAGLHVGHPLGYIASDIYARYKMLKGYNVMHPMGYDAFGLPAEQYAIQTGQHPAKTTEENIARYRQQLDRIGFAYDWDREIRTCDPAYYKWTQWAFLQMFGHYYDKTADKAAPINKLTEQFEQSGSAGVNASCSQHEAFTAGEWKAMSHSQQQEMLLNYRLAYLAETMVNWCPALGTVLANDEVKDGLSERGGHPVEQKKMKQWSLRLSAYAPRLLADLQGLEWSESIKEVQRNWIGRSEGAQIKFPVKGSSTELEIFTTRADTVYGATFMVLAPESELALQLTSPEMLAQVQDYIQATKLRSERDRMADTKNVTGAFTGSYAVNPLTGQDLPIWVSDYVLAGYGTGAIMAVPAHDSRDFKFARQFGLPIKQVVVPAGQQESDTSAWADSIDSKEGTMVNSGFITGLCVHEAIEKTKLHIKEKGIGCVKVNYRLRDAIFSRQRYWGEPFPIYFRDGLPYPVEEADLPVTLPDVDKFLPTETGEPPLGRAAGWKYQGRYQYELSTMPGFAGSSAYMFRYMDPANNTALVGNKEQQYWKEVDLYLGGSEHATGHLIYSRFWTKFLYDIGAVSVSEPFKRMINQGMIQGRSNFVYRITGTNKFVSKNLKDSYQTQEIHVDVNIVSNDYLDTEAFKAWRPEFAGAEFILEDGKYICGWAVEKMSKSKHNVVNPDDIADKYGADTLRLYEMFLGPLEMSKPWDTNGIDGAAKFLRKLWNLYHGPQGIADQEPDKEELKILHKTIKKITDDIEKFSFNTSVSAFMICVNELQAKKCNKRAVLTPLAQLVAPFAPHIAEELWMLLGGSGSVFRSVFPICDESALVEDSVSYPVSFNGKTRYKIEAAPGESPAEIEKLAMLHPEAGKWLEGKQPKKVIVVPGRIVNIVI